MTAAKPRSAEVPQPLGEIGVAGGIPVPYWEALPLILRPDFPGGARERLVALALMLHADHTTGCARPSVRRLAIVVGCATNTVLAGLRALAAAGVIECEARAGRGGSYRLILPVGASEPSQTAGQGVSADWAVPSQTRGRGQSVSAAETECLNGCDKLSQRLRQSVSTAETEPRNEPRDEPRDEPRGEKGARTKTETRATGSKARPTSIEEVRAYMAELGVQTFTAERFYDWHEARGWQLKSGPVTDWRACVRTWARRDGEQQAKAPRLDAQRAEVPRPGEQRAVVLRPGEHIEGLCGGCGKPCSLTICEACQMRAWGTIEMHEFPAGPRTGARQP